MSGVHRVSRPNRDQFTVLANHAVRNRALSRRARGLLWELCSVAEGWELRRGWLLGNATDSEHKLKTAVRELQDGGYLLIKRRANGTTTWLVTDDPDASPIDGSYQSGNGPKALPPQPQGDNPPGGSRPVKEEQTFLSGKLKEEEGPPPIEQEELLHEPPEVEALVCEVKRFCARTGVRKWPLKSETINAWCREVSRDVRYASINLAEQTRLSGEYWEARRKGKQVQPHTALRRWWAKAVEIADEKAHRNGNGVEPDWADSEAEKFRQLVEKTVSARDD